MKVNIAPGLRKYLPHLLEASEQELGEADTSQRICKVLDDVLGYDPLSEISSEVDVGGRYADLAVKIDGKIKFFVEIKAAHIALNDKHTVQAEHYASKFNIEWVLLTNGIEWNLYHLTFRTGIKYEPAFSVTLSKETLSKCAESIGILHRSSIRAGDHDVFWEKVSALNPESISKALFTEGAMRFMRREIRRRKKVLVSVDELATSIHAMFKDDIAERMGTPRIKSKKSVQPKIEPDIPIVAPQQTIILPPLGSQPPCQTP